MGSAGVLAAARMEEESERNTGSPDRWRGTRQPTAREAPASRKPRQQLPPSAYRNRASRRLYKLVLVSLTIGDAGSILAYLAWQLLARLGPGLLGLSRHGMTRQGSQGSARRCRVCQGMADRGPICHHAR